MADLGAVQLLCNTSGGGISKNMILYYMGEKGGGGLERGQIVLHNN